MKVRLEVLASVCIKRKKPWSQIVWLGKEKESLFLLDEKRISVLYVPSGKTKRNIQKLSTLLSECVCLSPAPDGLYLVGVQSSNEVFVWQKDKDELKTIVGLSSLLADENISLRDGCKAFPSPDCSHLLLVFGNSHVFLWQSESSADESKNNTMSGKWSRVTSSSSIPLPSLECKEVSMHAVFTYREVFGYCCQLSIVFNQQADLCVSSLLIRFNTEAVTGLPHSTSVPSSVWTYISRPLKAIQPDWEPINLKGAYSCQYSHDGQIIAVGINQKSPRHTSVLYLAAFTEAMLVSGLKGCGLRDPGNKRGRQYWISSMAWTSDNLFLAVILCNGSAGLLSRLGEPVVIFSKGCSVELGPAYFLPFSPLISVQSDRKLAAGEDDHSQSTNSDPDRLHQKFSVSSHPALPILLYSDGYIVTIVQLPSEFSPMIFMRDLVLESSSHLGQLAEKHRLDLTLANAYNLPAGEIENIRISASRFIHNKPHKKGASHYSFEEPSMSLNETLDSEVSFALGAVESVHARSGAVHNMSSGRIIFGEPDVLQVMEGSFVSEPNSSMKTLQLARASLFTVWKLAASTSEMWSANMDKILNHTVHNMAKLFSLVLDCPQIRDLLDEAAEDQLVNLPAVHTASLFRVITMYRQLLDLLQFDYHQRHLLAPVLQLSHKTLHTILSSVGLCQSDPRLKTLTGCFTLLKFTEKSLQQTYVTMPKTLQSITLISNVWLEDDGKNPEETGSLQKDMQLGKRLTATWKLLHKSVNEFLLSSEASAADIRQAQSLQSLIQQCLVELDVDIPAASAPASGLNIGDRLSLDGKHTLAVNAWKDQLKHFKEVGSMKNASRLFHSLLYTYILRNDLTTAISFVDSLIVKANPDMEFEFDPDQKMSRHNLQPSFLTFVTSTLRSRALFEPDMMPCIRDKAVRKVVQSMARFMAAYFGNQTIFIFPPHNPSPLPAVHFELVVSNSHVIPKYHENITAIIRSQKLDPIWTVERTLEYFMLSGLVCEATWFADRVGDWKTAYQLSVAHLLHKHVVPSVYERPNKPLTLPDWLTPDAIMKAKLEQLVKDDLKLRYESSDLTQLTKILEDIALAGILGFVEVGPWLVEQLVDKLKSVVKQLSPLVTKDFYLPAPPLYLPQPARTDEKRYSEEAEDEIRLREKASSIILLTLCVLNATHLSVEAVRWYVHALDEAQKKATQFKVNIEGPCVDLPDVLYQYTETESAFSDPVDDQSVASVLSSFRDLCSILWLLHARDKLSVALRTREKFMNLGGDLDSSEQWLSECFSTLMWASHMVAFSRFLPDEASMYKVILSLTLDFPSTEDIANIVAEYLYDLENLHPEVQERLDRMLNTWQGIILVPESHQKPFEDMTEEGRRSVTFIGSSPRGKSLSVYFHKQCMVMDKVLKRKKQCFGSYEEFVFTDGKEEFGRPNLKLNIGSRPFETKKSYLEFLDTFVCISFSKVLELTAARNKASSLPFLRVFSKDIVDKEMMYFVETVSGSAHRRHQGLSVLSGASQALARASSQERLSSPRRKGRGKSLSGRRSSLERANTIAGNAQLLKANRPVGLFRGMSMVDAPLNRSHAAVRRYESEPFLDELDSLDGSEPETPSRKQGKSQQNLASRYMQSEENIYRGGVMRDQGRQTWSLTVSFGKKYTALQQVMEWLEVWGGKSHSLGMSKKEEILDVAPKMKIQIPAQLIILALWLLEHKYGQNAGEETKAQKLGQSRRFRRLNRSPFRSRSLSPPNSEHNSSKANHFRTSPVNAGLHSPEAAHLSEDKVQEEADQKSGKKKLRSRETRGRRSKSQNDQPLRQSLPLASLEQDQIISAYTQLLDEPEGSSSVDVSSLASDELDNDLKATLNAIRGTGTSSPSKENTILGRTILGRSPERSSSAIPLPKDTSTPIKEDLVMADHRTPVQNRPPSDNRSRHSQTDFKNTNQSKSTSPPRELPSHARNQDEGSGIANQLQGVIRDELRRIMEVQHRSVLAMMGALEGDSSTNFAPATSLSASSASHSLPRHQKVGSNKRSKRHSHTQTSSSLHNQFGPQERGLDAIDSALEMMSAKEKAEAHSSPGTQAHRRQDRINHQVREALMELQNLQHEADQNSFQSRAQQALYIEDRSTRGQNLNSGYPRPPAESHVHLPYLPFQAWTDQRSQQPVPFHGLGVPRMPLLHINRMEEQEIPFRNLRHYLAQVPPPQPYNPQQYFQPPPPPLPPPPVQPVFSFFTPAAHPWRMPPPHYERRLPLLSVSSDRGSFSFPLLRFLAPGLSSEGSETSANIIGQREKVEETRQKLLRRFQEQVLAEREEFSHKMLHIETPEELESARSEKSKASEVNQLDRAESEPSLNQGRPPPVPEQQRAEVVDASTSDTRINSGFALPRGVFDSYLQLGEQLIGPEAGETNAAFQLRLALAMQRQTEKRIRAKVDFSTMTQEQVDAVMATDPVMESVRTAEAATSITKDAALDPVQEVVYEYNLKRHNNLIPPDIFMGLRFGDQDSQSGVESRAPSSAPGRGRSYLNVVDIHASSVLRDIPEREEKPEPLLDQEKLDAAILTSTKTAEQIGALEETLRQKFTQRSDRSPGVGFDAVTVKMFDELRASKENYLSVAVMPRSSISEPKAAMVRRLRDMTDQMKVIDEMSQNIEREFKSSRLLLKTIQEINDSVQRSRSPSPAKSKLQKSKKELRYSMEMEEPGEEDEERLSRQSSPDLPTPKTSAKSPQVSARSRSSGNSKSEERLSETETRGGLDELISEVVGQQGSYPQASEKMIEQLKKDTREQIQRSSKLKSTTRMDKLISFRQADEHVKSRTPYERQQLKAWMTEKFHQRQEEYRRRRNELIEREPKPFRSQTTVTKLDLKNLEEKSEKRINMVSEFMNQRLIDAENLLGTIIVDKPEIPWGSFGAGETQQRTHSRSPRRSGSSTSPQRPGASRKSRSPGRTKINTATWVYKAESTSRSPYGTDLSRISRNTSPVRGILKPSKETSSADVYLDHPVLTSISEGDRTLDSSTDVINYAKQVLEMEGNVGFTPDASYERVSSIKSEQKAAPAREKTTQAASSAQTTAKVKSFADMVRMQRPEATRKWKETNRQRQLLEEKEKQMARQEALIRSAAVQDHNLQKDKAKEYGSKKIPGFSPRQNVPRRVKTYTERLQEMKPTKQFSPLPQKGTTPARTISTRTFRSGAPLGPPHKPQTYVEQLQNLSSQAMSSQRSVQSATQAHRKVPVRMRTFLKSHGPKHKPKTYAEQLQELNPHPHKEAPLKRALQSTVTLQSAKIRPNGRARPYSDPYSEVDYEELASVLSDWDVDENIQNILYGSSSPTSPAPNLMNDVEMSTSNGDLRHIAPSEGQSDYYDAVMQGGLPYRTDGGTELDTEDYRSSVDIHEIERIAELASVGSGSILSVIDWDAVEDLIKDV